MSALLSSPATLVRGMRRKRDSCSEDPRRHREHLQTLLPQPCCHLRALPATRGAENRRLACWSGLRILLPGHTPKPRTVPSLQKNQSTHRNGSSEPTSMRSLRSLNDRLLLPNMRKCRQSVL